MRLGLPSPRVPKIANLAGRATDRVAPGVTGSRRADPFEPHLDRRPAETVD
jgi:hypothetical protein